MSSSMEELLAEALKYSSMGGKMPANKLIAGLIRSIELHAFTQVRDQLNRHIQELAAQGTDIGDESMNPFAILGVSINVTKAQLEKAYRNKAWKAHSDHGGSDEEMTKVNAAYEAIRSFKGWK